MQPPLSSRLELDHEFFFDYLINIFATIFVGAGFAACGDAPE
jgi:hypothetical protein